MMSAGQTQRRLKITHLHIGASLQYGILSNHLESSDPDYAMIRISVINERKGRERRGKRRVVFTREHDLVATVGAEVP